MEAVKVTGLSEEQIREAMKYGFTVQEVCSAWTAVQNSKKKKWRHDVVELLYVAGKAEKRNRLTGKRSYIAIRKIYRKSMNGSGKGKRKKSYQKLDCYGRAVGIKYGTM